MARTSRLVASVGLTAAAGLIAYAGPRILAQRVEGHPATAEIEASVKRAAEARRQGRRGVEREVTSAAGVEPLRAAIQNRVDGPTLVDLFENEDWWRPYRQD